MEEMIYPIKYAVMPVTNYAKNDGLVLGYIVTKAYIVMERTSYTPNGKKSSYDVVYPIKGLKSSEVMQDLRKPEFGSTGICTNLDHNNNIFDTFDEAKALSTEMNNNLFRLDIAHFTEQTERMQEFELKVLEKTFSIPNPEDINENIR